MANIKEPTQADRRAWKKWLKGRPSHVRAVAERFEPWKLYRMKSTGQRVTVYSFGEGEDKTVTLTVTITGEFNLIHFARNVFGIDPNDLEECDLPAPGEPVGATMTPEQVAENIDEIRLATRPDLFERLPDGSIVRKGIN